MNETLEAASSSPPPLVVNGESLPLPSGGSVAAVLEVLGLAGRPVAVEVDGTVVPRSRFADGILSGGERIEIVTFVGGG